MLFLLVITCKGFSQISSAAQSYQQLDTFLATPSLENRDNFDIAIKQWTPLSFQDQLAKVIALCNLGYSFQKSAQFPEAIKRYVLAKQLYLNHSLTGYDILNSCYIPLGNLYTKTNALVEAENTIKEYILMAQKDGLKKEEAAGLLNLSVVFHNKGAFNQALKVLQQAYTLRPNDIRIQQNIASTYFDLNQLEQAERLIRPLLQRNHVAAYKLQAKIELERGNPAKAAISLNTALSIEQQRGSISSRELAKLYLAIAQTELNLNLLEDSQTHLTRIFELLVPNYSSRQGLPLLNQLVPENTLIDALELQASIFQKKNKTQLALSSYKLAFSTTSLLDQPSILQESKLLWQTRQKRRSENCLRLLFTLYERSKDSIWLLEAFKIDQNSKSPVLQQTQAWQRQLLELEATNSVKNLAEVQHEISQITLEIERLQNTGLNNIEGLQKAQQTFNTAVEKRREIYAKLALEFPDLMVDREVSLWEIELMAKYREEVVVSYFIGDEAIYQFIISGQGTLFKRLAKTKQERDVVLEACVQFNKLFENASIINNNPQAFVTKAHHLYRLLQLPEAKMLTVIPDGILSFTPLSALITKDSQESAFKEMPFVLHKTRISYRLSLNSYLREKTVKQKMNLLGVFPVFTGSNSALEYSLREAEGINKTVGGTLLMNDNATAQRFLEEAERHNTIHISTHASGGSFQRPASVRFADRTLSIHELYGYRFRKDLVVLSACETGVGKVIKGEGAQSMARAFLYTGTENLIFSQWKVNDFSTAWLMKDFYSNIEEGKFKNVALHKAKLNYLYAKDIPDTRKSPYYWAGFVYYGETQRVDNAFSYLLVALTIIIALFLLLMVRRHYLN